MSRPEIAAAVEAMLDDPSAEIRSLRRALDDANAHIRHLKTEAIEAHAAGGEYVAARISDGVIAKALTESKRLGRWACAVACETLDEHEGESAVVRERYRHIAFIATTLEKLP